MRSSCENLWSASKSVVSPAGPPTANRAVRGSPGRAAWLAPRRCPPLRRRVAADLTVLPGDGRARVFEKRKGSPLLTAQSIDLRRASDPRIERVADRLGRSALIDQRQRDARVSGSLYPMTLSYACGSNKIDSDGHRSLVKRQHSTARRCIGLEGAGNTTASSVYRSNTSRGGGRGGGGRRELGPVRSAAGGVGNPPPAAALCCWGGQTPPF